ncbi:MAG TPA: hypothetical protein P5533_06150, partial [Candidatus Cloacimonadota bacterium]|nr:hypothetical protein [Candidatus Cloacimonadota bacterium]
VSLSWTAPVNSGGLRALTGYRIYRDNNVIANTPALLYQDSNLANGVYIYKVEAVYAGGISQPCAPVTAIVEVLYPPVGLSAIVQNRNDVALTWQAPAVSGGLRSFLSYEIYRNDLLLTTTSALNYSDPDLADGHYSYYVKAVYDSGSSPATNTDTVFIEYPYPPPNVQSTVNNADVTVSWNAVTGTGVQYRLYRNGSLLATLAETSYLDAGLANGSYEYYLISLNASESGASDPSLSTTAVVDVPYPPRMLSGSVSGDDVSLSWTAPANAPRTLLHYNVYRDGSLLGTSLSLNFSDPNLANGSYSYYVTAVYDNAESVASNIVNLLVEVYYPATALNAVVSGDDVALSWTAAVNSGGLRDIQGYKVYRDNAEIAQVMGTSYNDPNLANGIYNYYVTAIYSTGTSAASNLATAVIELLYPPSDLTYQTSDDNVLLSWTSAATSGGLRGFLGYNIYRDGALLATSNLPAFTDANLANGTYEYYVKANYSTGESTPTNTVSVLMEVLYPASNLSYQVSGDDVSLFWNAAPTSGGLRNFQGYRVLRDGAQIAFVNALSYVDQNLANGIYNYYIVAAYGTGDSSPTNSVNALVEVLYAPTALTHTVNGDTVTLQWTAAPNSARALLGYNVYRDGSLLGLAASTSYTDQGLANGIYSYYVTALYGTGESTPTNTIQATVEVLYAPSNLTYSVSDDDVSLFWNAAPSGPNRSLLGYQIYRDNSLLFTTSSLNYTDLNLANGTYAYYVNALYSSGNSLPTNTVNVLVEVYYPATALNAVVTGDDVALSWTAAVNSGGLRDIQGYKLFRDNVEIAQVIGTT